MSSQLDMYAVVAQQKALLALSQEQLQVVELEHRLVLAEQQRGQLINLRCGEPTADFQ